jgi:hypothetical protein
MRIFKVEGEGYMRRLFALGSIWMILASTAALAQENLASRLVGSWRLVSIRSQLVGDATEMDLMGPNPIGRAVYTADRHFVVFFSRSDRSPPTNDADAAALLRSMMGYTGRFRLDGDRMTTTVDGAWTEIYRQQDQVRQIRIDGDTLTVSSPAQPSGLYPGRLVVVRSVLVRETAQ